MTKFILRSLISATIFFACMVTLNYIVYDKLILDETTLFLTIGWFCYELYSRSRQESELAKTRVHSLEVVAQYPDKESAETICNKLKENFIDAIVVESDCPLYAKTGNDSTTVQVQVYRKDLERASNIINIQTQ